MNPGEDHCYSEQVKNVEDSGSEKDSVHTRPSLAPLRSDRSEVNKSSKSDCLDDIELNLSSKASREIELEDLDFVFEDDIVLNLSSRSSQESEEEDLEGIIDSLLELNSSQVIEELKPEKMATINPVTTSPPVPVLMTVGNEVIEITDIPQANLRLDEPLYKKEKRAGLTEDKLIKLFDKATRNSFNRFDLMSLALQDENKLDDTYSIGILISKARAALIRYDMHDVFNIAKVKSDGKNLEAGSKDLFTEYSIITEEEVAKSNRWYYTWPKAP